MVYLYKEIPYLDYNNTSIREHKRFLYELLVGERQKEYYINSVLGEMRRCGNHYFGSFWRRHTLSKNQVETYINDYASENDYDCEYVDAIFDNMDFIKSEMAALADENWLIALNVAVCKLYNQTVIDSVEFWPLETIFIIEGLTRKEKRRIPKKELEKAVKDMNILHKLYVTNPELRQPPVIVKTNN